MKIAIVIPTYNEAANLPELFGRLSVLSLVDASIVVVDDASPDDTAGLAARLPSSHPVVVLRRERERGLGGAIMHGMKHSLNAGAEVVVTMDADLSHHPEVLPELISAATAGNHLVLGSRRVTGGSVQGWSRLRDLVSRSASFCARMVLGIKANDPTTGLRAYRSDFLRGLDFSGIRSRGYAFQEEMVLRAETAGNSVVEVPIHFTDRTRGASKLSVAEAAASFGSLLRIKLAQVGKIDALLFVLVFGLAFALRYALAPAPGSSYDMWAFADWANEAGKFKWLGFYTLKPGPILTFPNYALYFPFLAWMGQGTLATETAGRILLKLPSIIGDLFLAFVIYRAAPRRYRLPAAAFFLFSPAVWYDSAVWGQTDVLHTFFAFLSVLAVAQKRLRTAWLLFVAAVFFKLQAIAILPLLLVVTACSGRVRDWLKAVYPAAIFAGLVALPYVLASGPRNIVRSLFNTVGTYPLVSYNAWNPWYLFQIFHRHVVSDANGNIYFQIGLLAYILSLFAVLHFLPKKAGGLAAVYAGALLTLAIFIFPTEMHERYLYQILPFLAFVFFRSWKSAVASVAISLAIFFNMNYVELWSPRLLPFSSAWAGIVWTVLTLVGFGLLFSEYLEISRQSIKPETN